ncbi:MAG: hypothetical protein LBU19_06030 [Treponema sp.]|nr:hypothetical protein [Treponema sp.]
MKVYAKDGVSIWYDKANKSIGFRFCKNGPIHNMDADDAVVIYAMLHNVIEDYFTDYPPRAGRGNRRRSDGAVEQEGG